MMRQMREKTKWVMIIVAVAFVGLMIFEWGMDISGTSVATQTGELGRVNGEPIPYEAYSLAYQQLYDQVRLEYGGLQLPREQIREIEDQAFNEVVNDILLRQEMRRRAIRVSDREIVQAAQWMPHPDLMQNEIFLTDGQFDISKYQQFLSGPAANEQLLLQLENYYRATIPRSKLIRQITSGLYMSDAELWQLWRDRNETATVDYVALSVSVLVPGDVPVTDREVRAYYDANRDRFTRPVRARVNLAYISKAATAADTIAALNRATAIQREILEGADFATVAARESDDLASGQQGGRLGYFGRASIAAGFGDVAFTIPIGEVSDPVATEFGYHLIQVHERTDDEVDASHILISYEPGDEALDLLYSRADSLEALAERGGIERAAGAVGAEYRTGVVIAADQLYVPGVGSAIEGLEWIEDQQVAVEPTDVSPVFETAESFYLVTAEAYNAAGAIPFAEASQEARRQLIVERKLEEARRIGQEMVTEVRGGRPLEAAASERGLTVETVGPITRLGFNPTFGQANAVVGSAFGVPIGSVSDVVGTPGGLFIIRPVEREEADRGEFEVQKEQLRQAALFQLQQDALARWMEDLRRSADILDRRNELMTQS